MTWRGCRERGRVRPVAAGQQLSRGPRPPKARQGRADAMTDHAPSMDAVRSGFALLHRRSRQNWEQAAPSSMPCLIPVRFDEVSPGEGHHDVSIPLRPGHHPLRQGEAPTPVDRRADACSKSGVELVSGELAEIHAFHS